MDAKRRPARAAGLVDNLTWTRSLRWITKRALDADAHCSLALAIDGFVHTNLLKQLDVALDRYEARSGSIE
jgi:hypothetical protein